MTGKPTYAELESRVAELEQELRQFRKIIHTSANLLFAEQCTLFLHDDDLNALRVRATLDPAVENLTIPNALGIVGAAFTSGKAINIPDAYADERFHQGIDAQTGFHTTKEIDH